MRRLLFWVVAMAFAFAACDDDKASSTAPTLGAIVLDKTACEVGDTVTAVVKLLDKGENWYFYRYKCTAGDTTLYSNTKSSGNYMPVTDEGEPTFKFVPLHAGSYTIEFAAAVSFTAGSTLYSGDIYAQKTTLTVDEREGEIL